ncbi:unnamed protein product [Alopecurus aequalis]
MSSSSGKARPSSWAAAMSVGVVTVEALKDQHSGLCRWNHAFRSVQKRPGSAAAGSGACGKTKPPRPASGAAARKKAKQDEEVLRTVMYLSMWGPNN